MVLSAAVAALWVVQLAHGQSLPNSPGSGSEQRAGDLSIIVGKSVSIDSARPIRRVAAANEAVVECMVITPRELLVNGKAPGETSVVVWQDDGARLRYDVTVTPSPARLNTVRAQIAREFGPSDIVITLESDTAFVRGTVRDAVSAERVMAIAATLGKAVNLLRVSLPPIEPQILLKVKFANVEHAASRDLGLNMATGAFNQSTALGTGQPVSADGARTFTLSQAVNILLFRKDINIVAALQALESKRLLEILAEPNLLVINGTQANFIAGGEFPYPVVQPGANGNSVTIAFKEYGIRLGFLPVITPRGTIRLKVAPEMSSLDYTNSVTIAGTVVPGTATRRVQTEVELESGQSFVIAGLLDRQTTETLSKVPGIASIPVLGKLFQSQARSKNSTELLVLITPEIVQPIPPGQRLPTIGDTPAGNSTSDSALRRTSADKSGPLPARAPVESIPVEVLTGQPSRAQEAKTQRN